MKQSKVKRHKAKDLDLLPIMNLFSILIPFLLSVAIFERLGILELHLPERSDIPQNQPIDIDPGLLNLSVIVGQNGVLIGGAAGFQPTIFYQEEVEYRSKSDKHLFRKAYMKGEKVLSPSDGKEMTPFEKETIFLHYVDKVDSADPGTFKNVAVNVDGEGLLDTANNWYLSIPAMGQLYRVVGDDNLRKMDPMTAKFSTMTRLSAYQEVGRQLELFHKAYSARDPLPPDVDDIIILADDDIIYDKIIQVMDACKAAGFEKVALSLLGGA